MTDLPRPGTMLSRREHETLSLMANGLDYIEVGATLGISSSTVASHCMRAMVRTGTSSLFQLGMWAQINGYRPGESPLFREDQCNCGRLTCDGLGCAHEDSK